MNAIDAAARPELLDSLSQIDAGWIAAVLAKAGHRDITVRDFAISPVGAGNVSDTVRLTVDHDCPDAPQSMVCKFRPSQDMAHRHGVASGAYHRELGAYRLIGDMADGCHIPVVLWLDGNRENINLVMEDSTENTRAGDQIAGCGIEDAVAVVRELAALHRATAVRADDAPDWAVRMPESRDYWVPMIEQSVSIIRDRFTNILPAGDIELIAQAAAVARAWYDLPHHRTTLTHGDPRVDNILFRDGAGGPQAILIDWQVIGVRQPLYDLGYFLSGSISVEDRRRFEHHLLTLYAEAFGPDYSHDDILADYRIQLISGLFTTSAAASVLPDTAEVNRLLLALLERNCAAVADWDTVEAITQKAGLA